MLLFILHYSHSISSAFAQKTIFCNENSNFPYYFQLCHRLYPLLQISSVICLIRLLEHNLPGQIFNHTFLFKPRLYEKERLHTLRVLYTVFLYPPLPDLYGTNQPPTLTNGRQYSDSVDRFATARETQKSNVSRETLSCAASSARP